jgi:translation elongation factor EF-1beta
MKLLTSKEEPEEQQEQYQLSNSDAYNLLTLGQITESVKPTALDKFRAAAAEREKQHKQRDAEMKARHAAGKEDMSGAIERLAQRLNKEETVNEVSVNTLQSYRQKATNDAIHRAASGKGGSLDRMLNVQRAKEKIDIASEKGRSHIQQTSMSESKENFVKDKNGKVRVFMLRRAAAKEAHQNGGVVHKQGAGYVIKLKESEDVTNINQFVQEETRSSTRVSGTRINEGSCGATQEQSGDCGCGCGGEETGSNQGRQKISLNQAKKKLKEKVKESIDRGIEPGMSMKKPVEELTGDETGASIGAQKEDELKKQGINLSTFKAKKTV